MDLSKLLKADLLLKCEELGIVKYKYKNKSVLIDLINKAVEEKSFEDRLEEKDEEEFEKINVIDLFCGCGGMSKGLADAGLNIIAGIDIWDAAIDSYKQNFRHQAICADLTNLPPDTFNELYNTDGKIIDLIVGGPPCFIAGTKVLTSLGYKNIEEVLLEDNLLTHTGKFQKIINLQRKIYTGDIYELDIKYHPEIINCTEEHPFYVREKKKIWNRK